MGVDLLPGVASMAYIQTDLWDATREYEIKVSSQDQCGGKVMTFGPFQHNDRKRAEEMERWKKSQRKRRDTSSPLTDSIETPHGDASPAECFDPKSPARS